MQLGRKSRRQQSRVPSRTGLAPLLMSKAACCGFLGVLVFPKGADTACEAMFGCVFTERECQGDLSQEVMRNVPPLGWVEEIAHTERSTRWQHKQQIEPKEALCNKHRPRVTDKRVAPPGYLG